MFVITFLLLTTNTAFYIGPVSANLQIKEEEFLLPEEFFSPKLRGYAEAMAGPQLFDYIFTVFAWSKVTVNSSV